MEYFLIFGGVMFMGLWMIGWVTRGKDGGKKP
jgi:hypothetical protein